MAKTKVIYLMGMGRSGGTLLGRLLGQHDKNIYVGELRYVWQRGVMENWSCGCGDNFKDCKVWSSIVKSWKNEINTKGLQGKFSIVERLNRSREFFYIFANKFLARRSAKLNDFIEFESSLYASIAADLTVDTIVESSRYPVRALLLDMIDDLDIYIVHLIRDSRGVVNSQLQKSKRMGLKPKKYPFKRVFHWLIINLMSSLCRFVTARDHYMYLRYEDFVADVEGSIKKILAFSGQVENACLSFDNNSIQLEPAHAFSGNENRFATGSISIKLDTKWYEQLPVATRWFISFMTYFPLKLYGYKKI